MIKKRLKTVIKPIIIVIVVLFMAFMLEVGLIKWGLGGLVILTLVVAGFRLWLGWNDYIRVVNMGAEQLRIIKQLREQDRNAEHNQREVKK